MGTGLGRRLIAPNWRPRLLALSVFTLAGGPLTLGWVAALSASLGAVRETSSWWLLLYGWSGAFGLACWIAAWWILQDHQAVR